MAAFALAAGWRDVMRSNEQTAYDRCVSGWASEFTTRAVSLGTARREVDEANDALWRGMADLLAHPRPDQREVFQEILDTYVGASDRYRDAVRSSPTPVPPELRCGR